MEKQEVSQIVGQLAPAKRAAEELGIPYTTLRDLAFKGQIPVIRLGRAWYFDRGDLKRFKDQHRERMGAQREPVSA
jgi:excisionase family DNA binding protein